jgi:hypothetical protein
MRLTPGLRGWLFGGIACALLAVPAAGQAQRQKTPPKRATLPGEGRPLSETWSGQSLNAAVKGIQDQWRHGVRGPRIALDEAAVAALNVTRRSDRGDASLLAKKGPLAWPVGLRGAEFEAQRKRVEQDVATAATQAGKGEVDAAVADDLKDAVRQMSSRLEEQLADLTPSRYIEGRRFVNRLADTEAALRQKDLRDYLTAAAELRTRCQTVADLARYLDERKLRIAAAWPGDETGYLNVHQALMNYLREAEAHRDK